MTTPTRHAPAARSMRRPPAPPRTPETPRRAPARAIEPVSFDRVLLWSLLVSGAVHFGILLLSPLFIQVGVPPGSMVAGAGEPSPGRFGMEWVVPVASPSATAEEPASPAEETRTAERSPPAEREREVGRPVSDGSEAGGAPAADSPERGSVTEALRPGYSDGRLWVNPRELRVERDAPRHDTYMEHLQARIDALNDSTYSGGPNTDWTFADKEGRRWGLSEKGLHLGGITIPKALLPVPRSTGTNADQEEERERIRQREEIIRQEGDRAREEERERSRKAAEERRGRGGGGG
jgi:hypothetical protein